MKLWIGAIAAPTHKTEPGRYVIIRWHTCRVSFCRFCALQAPSAQKKFAAPLTERRTCSDRLRSAVLSRQRAGHRRLRASSSATRVQSGCSCRMEPGHSGVTGPDTTALTAFALARPLATTSTLRACMMVLMPMV